VREQVDGRQRPIVLARERSDEAIQTLAPAAFVWIASSLRSLAMTAHRGVSPGLQSPIHLASLVEWMTFALSLAPMCMVKSPV